MNDLDRRRWEHSQKILERADEAAKDKPELAVSWYGSAYLLMAAVKLNQKEEAEAIEILSTHLVKYRTPIDLRTEIQFKSIQSEF